MRRDLPTGTVTFLFTDVVGSTQLLQALGAEAYSKALAEHRGTLREAFRAHGGVEVDTQGDGFFVAFPTAPGALRAAAQAVDGLGPGPIRIRQGLHTGTPIVVEEGYVGVDIHRAARIAACGHGGQVLVSAATAALLGTDGLRDLGEHRLKDLSAPERIYQLGDAEFAALNTLNQTNLPIPATPFLGRERELAEVVAFLERDDVRLLTLTGPGGTGKTRLSLQAAAEASDRYPDGVWWVPLAALRDPHLVLESAAQALGTKNELAKHIGGKRLLLLLDSFEHLVDAAPGISELLAACPKLEVLATSRELLHVAGEQAYPVPTLHARDGVDLFFARARAARPDFAGNGVVAELCARLDNLPLAIELAAARVRVLSLEQLLERLPQRLDLLKGGRDADPRQHTLRATITWSYDLLSQDEQLLFARLSVFSGGCTLDAAEQVALAGLDTLESLIDKSLLRHRGERYSMLETIREFAAEQFTLGNERESVRDRHVEFFLDLVERAEPQLTGPEQRRWYERLAVEQDNVREALAFACDRGDGERALMLAGTIWRFWWNRGQVAEASRWYERAFAVHGGASATARARGLFGAAHMAEARGDVEQTRTLFQQAADLLGQIGDTRWLILALTHLAQAYHESGDTARSEKINLEALVLGEANRDLRGIAIVKSNLAYNLTVEGDDLRAAALLAAALEGCRGINDAYGMAACLANLGILALRRGDVEDAAANVGESLRLSSSIGDTYSIAMSLTTAAAVVHARGDARLAVRLLAADDALRKQHGFELDPLEQHLHVVTLRALHGAVDDGFGQTWASGVDLDVDAAVDLALHALD